MHATVVAKFSGFKLTLKEAEYTLRNDLVLSFEATLTDEDHDCVERLCTTLHGGGPGELLNRGTSALLKFPLVPTHLPDGSKVTDKQLHDWIAAHPKWADVKFVKRACFVTPASKILGLAAMVLVEIEDGRNASTARRLLQMDISFGGSIRRTRPWSIARPAPQCGICLKWGHSSHRCVSKVAWCARCAGSHATTSHDLAVRSSGPLPSLCVNCQGEHSVVSRQCPFFLARFDQKKLASLQTKRRDRIRVVRSKKQKEKDQDVDEVERMVTT